MKKRWLYSLCIFFCCTTLNNIYCANAEDPYYFYQNRKISLIPDNSQLYVIFDEKTKTISDLQRQILKIDANADVKITKNNVMHVKIAKNASRILSAINNSPGVVAQYASRYLAGDNYVSIDNTLICMPKSGVEITKAIEYLKEFNPLIKEIYNYGNNEKAYLIEVSYMANVLAVSNYLHESGFVKYCHPNFAYEVYNMNRKKPLGSANDITKENQAFNRPNDPFFNEYYGNQWYLHRISAESAWDITTGSSGTKIVVMHGGFDFTNRDFTYPVQKYTGGYNAVNDNNDVSVLDASYDDEIEGTHLAGIICANSNNGFGIASVGYNIKVMPIRVIDFPDGHIKDEYFARATDYLFDNYLSDEIPAINLSWGIAYSENIVTAISNLRMYLRNNKGCVVVGSSGNDGRDYVNFPSSVCLSVGGTHACYTILNCTPQSQETRWVDANYGIDLDIVAPASFILTTNIGPEDDNFVYKNGTSDAVSMVCATVGLMASINPDINSCLLEKYLLSDGVDKLAPYIFSNGYPFGSWNNEIGYGRLNMYKAVSKVYGYDVCIDGPVVVSTLQPMVRAINSITATCNYSSYHITNTGSINFWAPYVFLQSEFQVDEGGFFQILPVGQVDQCENTLAYSNRLNVSQENVNTALQNKYPVSVAYRLYQNYPNPFNPTTTISYSLQENTMVDLKIYDLLGRVVKTLVTEVRQRGTGSVVWDGTNNSGALVSSGIYIYKLVTNKFVATKKMLLLK